MIDHVGFAVSDYERGKAFYTRVLALLGYALIMEVAGHDNASGYPAAGFGVDGKPDFWIGGEGGLGKPLGAGGGRQGQRRARPAAAVPSQLLRRVRLRPRRPQHRGGLPRPVLTGNVNYGRQADGGP